MQSFNCLLKHEPLLWAQQELVPVLWHRSHSFVQYFIILILSTNRTRANCGAKFVESSSSPLWARPRYRSRHSSNNEEYKMTWQHFYWPGSSTFPPLLADTRDDHKDDNENNNNNEAITAKTMTTKTTGQFCTVVFLRHFFMNHLISCCRLAFCSSFKSDLSFATRQVKDIRQLLKYSVFQNSVNSKLCMICIIMSP